MSSETKQCDNSMVLSHANVEQARKDESGHVYRVYCDGCFDLFHEGHMEMLQQAKRALGNPSKVYLLVGVCSDELMIKYKSAPVMNHKTRCNSVSLTKGVDEVISEAPWLITAEFLQKYRIDFVAHDAIPYTDTTGTASDATDIYAFVKTEGKFLETQRTEGISTSDIIAKIICDYDNHVERNLKRGFTKEDLNVGNSWAIRKQFHKNAAEVHKHLHITKERWQNASESAKSFLFSLRFPELRLYSKQTDQWITAREYVQLIQSKLPCHAQEMIYHVLGLSTSFIATGRSVASYCNPLNYYTPVVNLLSSCLKPRKKKIS